MWFTTLVFSPRRTHPHAPSPRDTTMVVIPSSSQSSTQSMDFDDVNILYHYNIDCFNNKEEAHMYYRQ